MFMAWEECVEGVLAQATAVDITCKVQVQKPTVIRYLPWQGSVLLKTKYVGDVSQATPEYKLCNCNLVWWDLWFERICTSSERSLRGKLSFKLDVPTGDQVPNNKKMICQILLPASETKCTDSRGLRFCLRARPSLKANARKSGKSELTTQSANHRPLWCMHWTAGQYRIPVYYSQYQHTYTSPLVESSDV